MDVSLIAGRGSARKEGGKGKKGKEKRKIVGVASPPTHPLSRRHGGEDVEGNEKERRKRARSGPAVFYSRF